MIIFNYLLPALIVVEVYKLSIIFLRSNSSMYKKIFETIILFIVIILSLLNYKSMIYYVSAIIISIYIIISFIYEKFYKKKEISLLSIKNAIDLSNNGIMFLDEDDEILLINNIMKDALSYFNINNNYIEKLKNKETYNYKIDHIIKCLDKIYKLKINNNEILLIDITDVYKLQEEINNQNKIIEENNKKILRAIKMAKYVEKEKNLIKVKNHFHDLLGHRLSLFISYLNKDKIDNKEIDFMLDNLFEEFETGSSASDRLNNMIRVYKMFDININVKGSLPKDKKTSTIFFEIIREAVTNAIMHASSHEILVNITSDNMIISNYNPTIKTYIKEGEGISGMRRKIKELNGNVIIENDNTFKIIVNI